MDYHSEFIKACRELGTEELCLGKRPVTGYPLKKKHWHMLHLALLAFQHQVKLIVADAIATEKCGREEQ